MKININIIGDLYSGTGYSSHTRSLANALYNLTKDVHLDVPRPPGWEIKTSDAELNMLTNPYFEDGYTIAITTPPYYRLFKSSKCKKFIGYCVFEGDKIPKYWLKYLSECDRIFVPSTHTKVAILNTDPQFSTPIDIIPHGVDLSIFNTNLKPIIDSTETSIFTFIANKGWPRGIYDRGGIQWLLKAYMSEFTNKDNVQLNIKINPVYNPPGWDFKDEVKKIGILKKEDSPKININSSLVDFKALPNFYHMGDVFVAPNMSEAFGLPILEAMACGLPPITTGFGGQTDYVNMENGWLLDYKLGNYSNEVLYENTKWGMPDIEQLKKIMRHCYDMRETDLIKRKSELALKTAHEFTWNNSAKKILEVLENLK